MSANALCSANFTLGHSGLDETATSGQMLKRMRSRGSALIDKSPCKQSCGEGNIVRLNPRRHFTTMPRPESSALCLRDGLSGNHAPSTVSQRLPSL